jgi:hypothetical protein
MVTGKVTLDCPAGTVTFAGTVAELGSELVRATLVSTLGGGVMVSVAVTGALPSVTLPEDKESARFWNGVPRISMSSMFQPEYAIAPLLPI